MIFPSLSARAVAQSVEDLHLRVAGEEVQDASVILSGNLPLLRGAGDSAREDRIQAERDLIYAARDFEDFRREFVIEIIEDFLNLVVQQQAVANAERQVQRLRLVEERERSLYEAGRTPRFQSALAEQSTVRAQDDLNSRRENYRLAVDRFKLRLNLPIDRQVVIVPTNLDLPVPLIEIQQAVQTAMTYRLDLQTQRDVQVDAQRLVEVARNSTLPDLELTGTVASTTDPTRQRAGLDFDFDETSFSTGLRFGLPLDREIERLNVRRAQIELERAKRDLDLLRDNVIVQVRSAVRDIDRAIFTLEIQERSIEIGRQRIESIEAAPDRASARDASDAANEFARAQDRRDSAQRDLQVAILRYLLETGQLRVDSHGFIRPLNGMEINGEIPVSIPALPELGALNAETGDTSTKLQERISNLVR
jgi:outer membrane protein TolC